MEDVYSGAGISVQALTGAWEVGQEQHTPTLQKFLNSVRALAAPGVPQGKEAPGGIAPEKPGASSQKAS